MISKRVVADNVELPQVPQHTSMIVTFDFDSVARRLQPLPAGHRVAFATSCTQRLVAIFRVGEEAWGWHGRTEHFQRILDDCWELALDPDDRSARDRVRGSDWQSLFRDGDHTDWRGYRLFAFRPLASLEQAVGCALNPAGESPAQAAQKEYEIMAGIGEWGFPPSQTTPGMSPDQARRAAAERTEKLHRHPIVQKCLMAQWEALDRLSLVDSISETFHMEFRQRALALADDYMRTATQVYLGG